MAKWTSHFHIICLPNRTVWPKLHWQFVCGMEINVVRNIMWHTFQAILLWITLWLRRFHLAIFILSFSHSFIHSSCSFLLLLLETTLGFSKVIKFQSNGQCRMFGIPHFPSIRRYHVGFPYHFLLSSYLLYSIECITNNAWRKKTNGHKLLGQSNERYLNWSGLKSTKT